ncbi:MAG: response regulator, partial [Ignavibacteria bacterium]
MIKVLIVEDELIVALELKSRLLDLGYAICSIVSSGEEAVEVSAEENPDLILMDINIKGAYDGVKTSEILKVDYDIPIIF